MATVHFASLIDAKILDRLSMVTQCNDAYWESRAVTGLLAAAIALLIGLAPATVTAQNLGTVTGTVTGAERGTALIGATVVLQSIGDPAVVRETRTASNGTYRFTRSSENAPRGSAGMNLAD